MHLAEGVLPAAWVAGTTALAIPLIAKGGRDITRLASVRPQSRALLGLLGAAVFAVSALPIPVPVAGSVSHPTGTALAAIVLRPSRVVAISAVVLAIQALFMAHGGISTWGANVITMGVVGSFTGYFVFRLLLLTRAPLWLAAGAAGAIGDFMVYVADAAILAAALGELSLFPSQFATIIVLFSPTQVPIAALEGILTAMLLSYLARRRPDLFAELGVLGARPAAVPSPAPASVRRGAWSQLWWLAALVAFAAAVIGLNVPASSWEGTDAAVFGKWAEQAGARLADLVIPIEGQALFIAFALAGAVGGLGVGYFVGRIRNGAQSVSLSLPPAAVIITALTVTAGLLAFLMLGLNVLDYSLAGDLELLAYAGVGIIGGAAIGDQAAALR